MKINVQKIARPAEEEISILCYEIRPDIEDIISFVKSKDMMLSAYEDTVIHQIPLQDIFYMETVNNRSFAYLEKNVYELKMKLYEFEEQYEKRRFFRCSKSVVVNLMKIASIKPALNSRFSAKLVNGEEVIISRQYVGTLMKRLGGEDV